MKHDPVPAEFQRDLEQALARAGGQSALARQLGVSQSTVSLTRNGDRFPLTVLVEKLGWEKVAVLRRKKRGK